MSEACAALVDDGVIRGVLSAVDCQTRAYAQTGYMALTGGNGTFQIALTALLTIYVALIGYRMLFATGGARLSDAPGIALRIGAVLALVTSWAAFQTLVFDVADRAPVEIAALTAAPLQGESASLAAYPIEGLQVAYDQLTQTAVAFGKAAGPNAEAYSSPEAAAAQATSAATGVLFLMSAGVISAAKLAIGVLSAVGPVFIALFLIPATRGLFLGWVRALAAAGLVTLVGWLLIVLMLTVLDPWLVTLARQRQEFALDSQTAISAAALVFVFGAGQAALLISAGIMALGLRWPAAPDRSAASSPPAPTPAASSFAPSRAERLAFDLRRETAHATIRERPLTVPGNSLAPRQADGVAGGGSRLGEAYRRPAPAVRRPA